MTNTAERTPAIVIAAFPLLLILIGLRILWQQHPGSVVLCTLFWIVALSDDPFWLKLLGPRRAFFYGLAWIGGICNALATLSNGGYMPVLGMEEARSVWVPMTSEHNLQFLCDIYSVGFGTASAGDFMIAGGLLGLIVNWALTKLRVVSDEPFLHGSHKRLPGLGVG